MKKTILFFVFYFCLNSLVLSAQQVQISTHDELPPFVFTNTQGELTGIYIEIVKRAFSNMPDYSVVFKVLPWARAKMEVEKGKTFAILPPYFHAHDWLSKSEPKRPYIWPYSLPLLTQRDVVICNEKVLMIPRIKFPEDYQDLKFVMTRGDGKAGEAFIKMTKEKIIDSIIVNGTNSIIPTLLTEMADCTVTSKLHLAWQIKRMQTAGLYKEYNTKGVILKEVSVIASNDGYLGYTDIDSDKNFPFKKDFSIKFNIAIYKMKKHGEIQKIVDSFIK